MIRKANAIAVPVIGRRLDDDAAFFRCIDGLWSILDAICRDPAWRARVAHTRWVFVPVSREYAMTPVHARAAAASRAIVDGDHRSTGRSSGAAGAFTPTRRTAR